MTKKELIRTTLENLGYKPEEDNEGDIKICYQLKTIFFLIGDEEDPYLTVLLPQFHEIAEGEETLTLAICNKVTCEIRIGKVYVDQTFRNVSAAYEFYYTDEESMKLNVEQALHIFGIIRTIFRNTKQELEK